MKFASAIGALLAVVFLALGAGTVQAEGVITGSVLRVDEQTYRLRFEAYWVLDSPHPCLNDPPRDDAYPYCTVFTGFSMSGPFGSPRNTDLFVDEDQVRWQGPGSGLSSQFDFDAPSTGSSRLELTWGIGGDLACQWCWPESCIPSQQLCQTGSAGGQVFAVLPINIGDSAPLEPVVGVAPSTWGMVKRLYGE